MNTELSLKTLWLVFKKSWVRILVVTLAAMLLMGVFTQFVMTKKYTSTVTFYVVNTNANQDFEQTALVAVKDQLANEYIEIIKSEVVLEPIVKELKETHGITQYSARNIRAMLSSSIKADIGIFDLNITTANSEHAYIIASLFTDMAPDIVREIKKPWAVDDTEEDAKALEEAKAALEEAKAALEENSESYDALKNAENAIERANLIVEKARLASQCMSVLNQPKLPTAPSSPNLAKNVLIVGLAAAAVTYVILLVFKMFDTVIKNEDDIKEYTDKYPLIATIPTWMDN